MLRLGRIAALTFDCYGTLIDWERGILAVLRPWARRHGLQAPDEELLQAYGEAEARFEATRPALAYPDVLRRVHADLAARFGITSEREERNAFAASIRDWPAFPDTAEALRYLERHYRIAIVSNVDRRSFAYTRARLGTDPDFVVTADDVGAYKPDRPHFERALERLAGIGVDKQRLAHVAQSLYHDITPAQALGIATIWVDRRHGRSGAGIVPPAAAKPDLRVTSLRELVTRHEDELGASVTTQGTNKS